MRRNTPELMNRLSLIANILGAALVVQPAVEYESGTLVVVILVLLAAAAANLIAIVTRSKG